jgi:hypothetical protein
MTFEHKLYSCSLDAAPDTIENDRRWLANFLYYCG